MRFGLFYEMSVRGRTKQVEQDVFTNCLNQIELADQLGFGSVWFVEHHFVRGFSHSSSPEMLLAAASQRTSRIRLGHGVVIMPVVHPTRIAARMAALDILSGGRAEFGVGRGASPTEYHVFDVPFEESRPRFEECLDATLKIFHAAGEEVGYDGKYYKFPPVRVIPQPVQEPHPPVWAAVVSQTSWDYAARLGLNVLVISTLDSIDKQAEYIARYKQVREEHGHDPEGGRVGLLIPTYVGESSDEAFATAADDLSWYFKRVTRLVANSNNQQEINATYQHFGQELAQRDRDEALVELNEKRMVILGDRDHFAQVARDYEAIGLTDLLPQAQLGGLSHDAICGTLHRISEAVDLEGALVAAAAEG
jgi:alkanesulfonate monooxygenase SsuD/methylene tetrahydromethanopterin reductase-like flavin-dependent oxidoreductase (luciferase family)